MADAASTRSPDGLTAIEASSEKSTTPTRSAEGARVRAPLASCRARSNRPGAAMLCEMSSATIVTPPRVTASPEARNGRAKARASSTSAATRSASNSSSRSRCFSVSSTGACFNNFTAANFTRGSGSRLRRCSTIGTAAAPAPTRNSGDRNVSNARLPPSQRPRARGEVRHQGELERMVRSEQLVVDAGRAKLTAVVLDERADFTQVVRPHGPRNGRHLVAGFEIFEARGPIDREIHLVGIENVKDEHVGPAKLKMLQATDHRIRVVQEIRDEDDHAALGERIGQLMQRLRNVGGTTRPQTVERQQRGAQMTRS